MSLKNFQISVASDFALE